MHNECFFVLAIQITDLKLSMDLLENERDFYFAKLRDIEILCQTPELENLPVRLYADNCASLFVFPLTSFFMIVLVGFFSDMPFYPAAKHVL